VIAIPFDVDDNTLRATFYERILPDAMVKLDEHTPAQWGNMTAQHMVEHLLWAFEISTGGLVVSCQTPAHLLERTKRFLYDKRHTPHSFKNPLLGEQPPPFRFPGIADAKTALLLEVGRFINHFRDHPEVVHTHPIFGPLGVDEWQRSHFKHCYHHLLQFGLIASDEEDAHEQKPDDSPTAHT